MTKDVWSRGKDTYQGNSKQQDLITNQSLWLHIIISYGKKTKFKKLFNKGNLQSSIQWRKKEVNN